MKEFKRPESILVIVYNPAGEVLMLRRRKPAHFWQSVTGSLRWGETARDAAIRELYEETGLRAGGRLVDLRRSVRFPIIHPWRARYAPTAHFNLEHWFALQLPSRRLIKLNAEEHSEYRWLPLQRAFSEASSWTNRNAIRAVFSC